MTKKEKMKILVIDYDPAMTELLRLLLDATGSEITIANSGQEGMEMIRENIPDIIILDLMMPGTDAWTVCREVRSFSLVPILVLSALNSPSVIASSLDAGADDYLVKPVPNAVLLAHIQNLVKRTSPVYASVWNGTK
jgi:DNA-binding response OmpR family regulator